MKERSELEQTLAASYNRWEALTLVMEKAKMEETT
jgi:hypothetical protein